MDLTYLGKAYLPTLPPNPLSTPAERWTRYMFGYAQGPAAATGDRMFLRGHVGYDDIAECTLPDVGQIASVMRWFDPTGGRLASLNASRVGKQKVFHRGLACLDGGLYGNSQIFYSVANEDIGTTWFSDAVGFRGWGNPAGENLKMSGFLGELPAALRAVWGHDTWMFEAVEQGMALSNNGPALYTFNRKKDIGDGEAIPVTMRFEYPRSAPWRYFYGDCEIEGMAFTATHAVYGLSKPGGARWYGLGDGSSGNDINVDPITGHAVPESGVPKHTIASKLYPGTQARDSYSLSQGYHAEQHIPTLLVCSIQSLLDGNPEWQEIDCRDFGFTGISGKINPFHYDAVTGRLYVMEYLADAATKKPLIHIFQTYTGEQMELIEQLRAIISELEALIVAKDAANAALTEQVAAASATVSVLETQRDALLVKITAAQAALA